MASLGMGKPIFKLNWVRVQALQPETMKLLDVEERPTKAVMVAPKRREFCRV